MNTPAGAVSQTINYTCSGRTNDVAGYVPTLGGYVSSHKALEFFKSSFPQMTYPFTVPVTIESETPARVNLPNKADVAFTFGATLPSSLITAAQALNQYSVTIKDATFGATVTGGTPNKVTAKITNRVIWFNGDRTIRESVQGQITPNDGATTMDYFADSASIVVGTWLEIGGAQISTLSLDCTLPTPRQLGRTIVSSDPAPTTAAPTTAAPTTAAPTTAAPTTAAPTTAAPTTAAPTTAAPTTAAPTTAAPTTAAPTTAAPTTAAPTTAAPTTAAPTTVPQTPGADRIKINVSGHYNYAADVAVSGPGFSVASDGSGLASLTGFGTFPGRNGGTASATVNVSKFLWWSFGSITVNDPSAGLRNVEAPIVFGAGISGTKTAASVGASWFGWDNGFIGYSINVTVADNG